MRVILRQCIYIPTVTLQTDM